MKLKYLLLVGLSLSYMGLKTYSQNNNNTTNQTNTTITINKYLQDKNQIKKTHRKFVEEYKNLKQEKQKDSLESIAKQYLNKTIQEKIFPAWEGTEYDFYGTTKTPHKGEIACGWFVQRCIEALDFQIITKNTKYPKFAQNWPETTITGINKESAEIIYKKDNAKTIEYLKNKENGTYIIGFADESMKKGDHMGFITINDGKINAIHSLGYVKNIPLKNESYYIYSTKLFLNNLFNDKVVKIWLENKKLSW